MTASVIPFPARSERGDIDRIDAEIERRLGGAAT